MHRISDEFLIFSSLKTYEKNVRVLVLKKSDLFVWENAIRALER